MFVGLNLGCGPMPIHEQHTDLMVQYGPLENWTLIDLYCEHQKITNMDATVLAEVENDSVDVIYSSHLLEHLPHAQIPQILKLWRSKLKVGGELILNVPDLVWACEQLLKLEKDGKLEARYSEMEGEHGLQCVFFGNQAHEGEYHKVGFTNNSLTKLLKEAGFADVKVSNLFEAHDMGCLIAEGAKQ